jgi:NAD(P)H-flavin reductase
MATLAPQLETAVRDFMVPHQYVVQKVAKETPDTFTLTVAPEADALPAFAPGQFSMLWAFGVGEVPISISGDPGVEHTLTYTIRSVGATTQAIVSRKPGESFGIRGPYGAGWPMDLARGRDVVIVAGGIGLAPLRPAIYHVLRHRDQFRRLIILYGARHPRELLYRKELASWARQPDTQVVMTVDHGNAAWHGNVGVVTTIFKYARLRPEQSIAMVCGPEIMMRFVNRELLASQVAPENLFLSMERNMRCGTGFCGHCQWGPLFICKDGPVFRYDRIRALMDRHEL